MENRSHALMTGFFTIALLIAAVLAEKHVLAVGPACDVLRVKHPFIKQFFLGPRGQRALEVLEERYAGKESKD